MLCSQNTIEPHYFSGGSSQSHGSMPILNQLVVVIRRQSSPIKPCFGVTDNKSIGVTFNCGQQDDVMSWLFFDNSEENIQQFFKVLEPPRKSSGPIV